MLVSILIIAALFTGIISGYQKGLFSKLWGIISTLLSYCISFVFHGKLAVRLDEIVNTIFTLPDYLKGSVLLEILLRIVAFILIFFFCKLVLLIIFKTIESILSLPFLKEGNKALGSVFGFVEMYLIVFLVIAFLTLFPIRGLDDWVESSSAAQFVLNDTPILSEPFAKLMDTIKNEK